MGVGGREREREEHIKGSLGTTAHNCTALNWRDLLSPPPPPPLFLPFFCNSKRAAGGGELDFELKWEEEQLFLSRFFFCFSFPSNCRFREIGSRRLSENFLVGAGGGGGGFYLSPSPSYAKCISSPLFVFPPFHSLCLLRGR